MIEDIFKTDLPFAGCKYCIKIDPQIIQSEDQAGEIDITIKCRNQEICEEAVRCYNWSLKQ